MPENGRRAIDADSHVGLALDTWDRFLDPSLRDHPRRPRFEEADGIHYFLADRYRWPSHTGRLPYRTPSGYAPGPRGGVDADYRMEDFMDPEGVDRGMLMPGRFMSAVSYFEDIEIGNAQARAYNDWLADFCSSHPTRLFGFGVINVADPSGAVAEMRRCVHELGFPAIYMSPSVVGRTPDEYRVMSDEHFYPMYEEAARLDVPLSVHAFSDPNVEGHSHNWPMSGSLLWSDIVGFPFQGMQVFVNLVLGGVCDAFPETKFGIFESGLGWMPMVIDRIHERQEKFTELVRMAAPNMELLPEEYIQRQIWMGFEPEDPFLPDFIRWTGAPERTLLSIDYPHLDYEPGQLEGFRARGDVSEDHIRLAEWDNSIEYFKWEETAAR